MYYTRDTVVCTNTYRESVCLNIDNVTRTLVSPTTTGCHHCISNPKKTLLRDLSIFTFEQEF